MVRVMKCQRGRGGRAPGRKLHGTGRGGGKPDGEEQSPAGPMSPPPVIVESRAAMTDRSLTSQKEDDANLSSHKQIQSTNTCHIHTNTCSSSHPLQHSSEFYERYVCLVCWYPKLRMVYGMCQHRICEDCLYRGKDEIDPNFMNCPACMMPNSFPPRKPCIPEDNVEQQRFMGATECPVSQCRLPMWIWELEEHNKVFHKESCKPPSNQRKQGRVTKTKKAVVGSTPKAPAKAKPTQTDDNTSTEVSPRSQRMAAREARLRCIAMTP